MKVGDVLDARYRIVRTLGAGSLGTVYLAEHVLTKRPVAIKILRAEIGGDAEVFDGFMTEARAAGSLDHPHIVACTDSGFTGGQRPYIVLEYVEGTVLTDEIYRLGGLPIRRALKIADQIAAALTAAHDAGIVHGSLTSDSAFLIDRRDARDTVKVVDFGVARLFGLPDGSRNGVAGGAPEFMSPEQLTSDAADRRVDIYALGAILYEMLTARRPFSDDDRRALIHRVVNEPPPPLLRPDAPPGLEELIVTKLLAKDPAQRCASMAAVQRALAAFSAVARPGGPLSGEIEAVRAPELAPRDPEHAARDAELAPRAGELTARDAAPLPPPAEAVALPALASWRALRLGWLLAAALAAAAGGGVMFLENQTRSAAERVALSALDGDAEKLAGLLETEARAAQLRADGVAAMPMLRAAIETDVATLKDMAGSDFIFTPRPGEVLQLFQIRNGSTAPVLRIPETGPAIPAAPGNRSRIVQDGGRITIVAGAPIARQHAGIGGTVAISVPVDLAPLKRRIAEHARSATLIGLGAPLPLAGTPTGAPTVAIPIPLGAELEIGEVALTAVVAPPAARPELRIAGLVCWALAGVLLALFTASLFRRRGDVAAR